jgi:hypothetical protein
MQQLDRYRDSNGTPLQQAAQQRSQAVTAEASRGASTCQCLESCTNEPECVLVSGRVEFYGCRHKSACCVTHCCSSNTLLRLDVETVLTCIIHIVSDAYLGIIPSS